MSTEIIPAERIAQTIIHLRGQKVILDYSLATLYGVETRALKQAVRRSSNKFPGDFMFELSTGEIGNLVSQSVIPTIQKLGGATPMAFTEQGVAMLSSVLKSERAKRVGEHTRLACWRGRPRHRKLSLFSSNFALRSAQKECFSASRRKEHASRGRSPIPCA